MDAASTSTVEEEKQITASFCQEQLLSIKADETDYTGCTKDALSHLASKEHTVLTAQYRDK